MGDIERNWNIPTKIFPRIGPDTDFSEMIKLMRANHEYTLGKQPRNEVPL